MGSTDLVIAKIRACSPFPRRDWIVIPLGETLVGNLSLCDALSIRQFLLLKDLVLRLHVVCIYANAVSTMQAVYIFKFK